MNTAKRIFDVHILESNRSGKTAEGEALGRVLDISGIRTHHYPVHTVDEIASAFGEIAWPYVWIAHGYGRIPAQSGWIVRRFAWFSGQIGLIARRFIRIAQEIV
jgi:hypothetical protein